MKKSIFSAFIILSLLMIGSKAHAEDANVNATVDNPVITSAPTPTGSITPTTTLTPTLTPTITPTPTLAPGVSATPTPTPVPGAKIYLDISGFISPFASVIMTTNGQFVRSVVADKDGNFFISQIEVNKGFSEFCLEGIDFKRVGDSITCFKIPPVSSSTSKKNIFLPPTIGLSAHRISAKASAFTFGYTMPEASVTLHISGNIVFAITADKTGFYKFEIKNLPVGTYELFATASYQKKDSEKPSKTLELQSVSEGQGAIEKAKSLLNMLFTWITGFFNKGGWIGIPIFILIIILLSKKLRDRIRFFITREHEGLFAHKTEEHILHHAWMFGY